MQQQQQTDRQTNIPHRDTLSHSQSEFEWDSKQFIFNIIFFYGFSVSAETPPPPPPLPVFYQHCKIVRMFCVRMKPKAFTTETRTKTFCFNICWESRVHSQNLNEFSNLFSSTSPLDSVQLLWHEKKKLRYISVLFRSDSYTHVHKYSRWLFKSSFFIPHSTSISWVIFFLQRSKIISTQNIFQELFAKKISCCSMNDIALALFLSCLCFLFSLSFF